MLAVIFAGAFRLVWNLNSLARHEFEPHPHSIPSAWCNLHGRRNHLHDVALSLFLSRPAAEPGALIGTDKRPQVRRFTLTGCRQRGLVTLFCSAYGVGAATARRGPAIQ